MYDIKYIKESGICPWEQEPIKSDSQFQTITIVAKEKATIVRFITAFMHIISYAYKQIFRWSTTGYQFEGGIVQRKKLLNTLRSSLPGFINVFAPNNFPKNVPCSISELSLPFDMYHYDAITDGRYSILIFSKDESMTPQSVYDAASDYVFGLNAENLTELLTNREDSIIARAYEHPETHAVFQLIGHKEIIEQIEQDIQNKRILESDRDTVAVWSDD
jgi:hypothetical protein